MSSWGRTFIRSPRGEAQVSSLDVTLELAPVVLERRRFSLSVSWGVLAEHISAQGVGISQPRQDSTWIPAVCAAVRIAAHVTEVMSFQLSSGVMVPLLHPRFLYYDEEGATQTLHQTAPATLIIELAISLHFFS